MLEGLIILRALKKVNFVGPCRIVANNDPFSVSLLTQTHSHSPPGVFNKDGIVGGKNTVCVCVRKHKHAESYAFMCMLIKHIKHMRAQKSQTLPSSYQDEAYKESVCNLAFALLSKFITECTQCDLLKVMR